MKKLVVIPFLLLANPVLAVDPNPFMSAEDRQAAIEKEMAKESDKIKKLVEEAVRNIRSGDLASEEAAKKAGPRSADKGARKATKKKWQEDLLEPSDFAIAAIKGHHILIRQMGNRSLIVDSGQQFWDKGQAYEARILDHESVEIMRVADGKIVFFGGVGSVFTPSERTGSQAGGDRRSMEGAE